MRKVIRTGTRADRTTEPYRSHLQLEIGIAVEPGFHIEDRCPVQCFEVSNLNSQALDRNDLNEVETDRIGTIRRSSAEHSVLGNRHVIAWMHSQDVAPRPVQPCQHNDLVSHPEVLETLGYSRVEDEPSIRRSLVALFRCRSGIGERRLDRSDRSQHDLSFNRRRIQVGASLLSSILRWILIYR